MEFTELNIPRFPGPLFDTTMTGPPKSLEKVNSGRFLAAYDPMRIEEAILSPGGVQEFTVYPAVPLWLMSPGLRVYRKQDVIRFHGYFKEFKLDGVNEAGEPEAVVRVEVVQEKT
jgi:hypothetical protein